MKEKLFSLLMSVFILFCCSVVLAQETPKKIFDLMDANQDGKVTKEEFMNFYMEYATKIRDARFDQLDTNGDGNLTRKEFMVVQIEEAEKIGKFRFQRIDANKDGVISEEELKKRFGLVKQSLDVFKAE